MQLVRRNKQQLDFPSFNVRPDMRNPLLEVAPVVPRALARLPELAANLFFSWHRPTRALFEDLDRELWKQASGNGRLMLRCMSQDALDAGARDAGYLARYAQVLETFDSYLRAPPIRADAPLVGYFCAEYGFHESFPIYSGGLGVLAGDHCKAASDERMNFVAVGLLYGQGFFTQSVDNDGVQCAQYREHDPRDLPVEPLRQPNGLWLTAVSYTHLDVYKRQRFALGGSRRATYQEQSGSSVALIADSLSSALPGAVLLCAHGRAQCRARHASMRSGR